MSPLSQPDGALPPAIAVEAEDLVEASEEVPEPTVAGDYDGY